jgi:hypothetical protein
MTSSSALEKEYTKHVLHGLPWNAHSYYACNALLNGLSSPVKHMDSEGCLELQVNNAIFV